MSTLGFRVVLTARGSLPVYPDEQTFSQSIGMSQRCQEETIKAMIFTPSGDCSTRFGYVRWALTLQMSAKTEFQLSSVDFA
jgi:hypothetical protein